RVARRLDTAGRAHADAPVTRRAGFEDRLAVTGQIVGDAAARRPVVETRAGINAWEIDRRQLRRQDAVGRHDTRCGKVVVMIEAETDVNRRPSLLDRILDVRVPL